MKALDFLKGFVLVGVLTFVVGSIVSYLYSLVVHGAGVVDWGSAVRLGIILGIVMPSLRLLEPAKAK